MRAGAIEDERGWAKEEGRGGVHAALESLTQPKLGADIYDGELPRVRIPPTGPRCQLLHHGDALCTTLHHFIGIASVTCAGEVAL